MPMIIVIMLMLMPLLQDPRFAVINSQQQQQQQPMRPSAFAPAAAHAEHEVEALAPKPMNTSAFASAAAFADPELTEPERKDSCHDTLLFPGVRSYRLYTLCSCADFVTAHSVLPEQSNYPQQYQRVHQWTWTTGPKLCRILDRAGIVVAVQPLPNEGEGVCDQGHKRVKCCAQELRGILDRSGRFVATRAASQPLPLSPFDAAISRAFTASSQVNVPVGAGARQDYTPPHVIYYVLL